MTTGLKPIKKFDDMSGETVTKIENKQQEGTLDFYLSDGRRFRLYHEQGCCESVYLEDVVGELTDLLNSPLLMCEEVSNYEGPNPNASLKDGDWGVDSYTWTFYKLATIKGYVTLRWYGSSNGYYSESVNFAEVSPEGVVHDYRFE